MDKKQGKKAKKCFWALGVFLVLAAAVTAFFLYENSRVYKTCYAEAGIEVTAQDFLKNPEDQAYFAEDSDVIDSAVPGEYHMKIRTGYFTHESTLYITDTIAPQGEPVKVNLEMGGECGAEAFVSHIQDATQVEISYGKQPDFASPGRQDIEIVLTDLGGNRQVVVSELFISQVVTELTVEAGSTPPELKDFVIEAEEAELLTEIGSWDYAVLGDRIVELRVDGRGDCYVYASTAKALLTGAGIANMDIAKIPSGTSHYWNLVDVGYGWYHFDTTPRRPDHPHICMWTEAQLMEYSAAHNNCHNYDHSLYPAVN